MAISTLDQLLGGLVGYPTDLLKDSGTAEAAGVRHSLWYTTGTPGAGAAPSSGLAGGTHSGTVAGQIPLPAASNITYLARLEMAQTGNIGRVEIYDRLWTNSGFTITTTTGQTVNSVTFPLRDSAGSSNGADVRVAIEVSAATGNGGAITNTTLTYTNSAGTGSRTGTIASFPATAVAGTFVPFSLAAGDIGVRSIQTLTLGTSYVSGTIHLVAYRLIASIPVPTANIPTALDFAGLGLPRIWDNSVLWPVVLPTGTALGSIVGSLGYAQG